MKKRLLTAAMAAAGLAALGTVIAQQPMAPLPPAPPASKAPATTVRPYSEWTPTPAPAGYTPKQNNGAAPTGGYLPPPPGYTPTSGVQPAGGTRLTTPAVAGGTGVRPAGATMPQPSGTEVPSFKPSTAQPPIAAPAVPAIPSVPTIPGVPSAVPSVPPLPTGDGKFPALPVPVTSTPTSPVLPPSTPVTSAPTVPGAPPSFGAVPPPPSPFPAAAPTTPMVPAAPTVPMTPSVAAPTTPTVPMTPSITAPATTVTPTTTLAPGVLPARATPAVTVEAICPETVAFGQEFTYKLVVRNTGTGSVSNIRVDDEVPAGSKYVGSDPMAELTGDRLTWMIGTLDGGAEKTITVRVKPSEEGEARSRATVTFTSSVDARTRVTRPRIAISASGAEVCRAGEETTFRIKVTNSGTGPAPKYFIRAQLSDGLLHSQGTTIEAPMELLQAGETKAVELKVAAAKAGLQWCQITVTADGSPDATAKASTNVVEPLLQIKQTGPAKVLVRAEPTYTIELSNPGTAGTDPILLQSVMPEGFEWINQASDSGTCNGRTVSWRLPGLPAGSNRSVTLKLRASAASDPTGTALRTVAQAGPANVAPAGGNVAATAVRPARALEAKAETTVVAEGVAAVRFDVVGLDNPVTVGKEVTYEIRVLNSGTGACSNVQLAAALAEGTEFVGATTGNNQTGAVKAVGQQLTFDAIPSFAVKGEIIYRVRVKSTVAGDLRIRVQLSCDQLKTPVVKEESTTFVKE